MQDQLHREYSASRLVQEQKLIDCVVHPKTGFHHFHQLCIMDMEKLGFQGLGAGARMECISISYETVLVRTLFSLEKITGCAVSW